LVIFHFPFLIFHFDGFAHAQLRWRAVEQSNGK